MNMTFRSVNTGSALIIPALAAEGLRGCQGGETALLPSGDGWGGGAVRVRAAPRGFPFAWER